MPQLILAFWIVALQPSDSADDSAARDRSRRSRECSDLQDRASEAEDERKFGEAEALHRSALLISARIYGLEHWKTRFAFAYWFEAAELARLEKVDARRFEDYLNSRHKFEAAIDDCEYASAASLADDLLKTCEELLGTQSPALVSVMVDAAQSNRAAGKYVEAISYAERAVEVARRTFGADSHTHARAHAALGICELELWRNESAAKHLQDAVEIVGDDESSGMSFTVIAHVRLGDAHRQMREYEKAEAAYRRAFHIARVHLADDKISMLHTQIALVRLLAESGRAAEGAVLLPPLMRQAEETEDDGLVREALKATAITFEELGKFDQALEYATRAADSYKTDWGSDYPLHGVALLRVASIQRKKGDAEAALPAAKEALTIVNKCFPFDHHHVIEAQAELQRIDDSLRNE